MVVCEHKIVKRDRFWFGTAMIAVPVLFLLVALSPGIESTWSGRVEGHVSYHGHPLAGGSILFVPEDTGAAWAHAWIDENGHYEIGSSWSRTASRSGTRYRICLIPDSHRAASPAPRGAAKRTAWSGAGAFPAPAALSGFPAKFCDARTTPFGVVLGSEPTRVDITF
jgi:hypothetical protein